MAILNRPALPRTGFTRPVEVAGQLRFKKFALIPRAGWGYILTDPPRLAPPIFTKMPLGLSFPTHTHTHTHTYIYIYIYQYFLFTSTATTLSLSSLSRLIFLTPLIPSSYRQPLCQPPCRSHAASHLMTSRRRQNLTASRRHHLSLSLPHANSPLTKSEYFFFSYLMMG